MKKASLDRLRDRMELAGKAHEAAKEAFHAAIDAARGVKVVPARIGWPKGKKRGRKALGRSPLEADPVPVARASKPPGRAIETLHTPNPATEATE